MKVKTRAKRYPPHYEDKYPVSTLEFEIVVYAAGRRTRFGAFYGTPPGSHMGFWRTRAYGMNGLNYRIGSFRRSLTFLLHSRPTEPAPTEDTP